MISPIGTRIKNKRQANSGFTLIELILVMAILTAVIGVSAPVLSRFFRGQALDEETRRLYALLRYSKNQAISQAVPMTLWIDTQANEYGLQPMTGYEWTAFDPITFQLDESLTVEVVPKDIVQSGRANIVYSPDGTLMEPVVTAIVIRNQEQDYRVIGASDFRFDYEIKDNEDASTVLLNV